MSKRAPKSDRGFPVKLSNSSTAKSSAAESSSSAASRVEVRIPKAGSDSPPQHLPRPSNSESASPAPIRAEIRIPARPVTASTRILQPSPTRLSSVPIARLPREPTPPANELPPLTDAIAPNLLVLFVGHNPGLKSSQKGHAYSSPSNWFWRLLHKSGCTPYKLMPEEDQTLPSQFGLGNTNIVARPTRSTSKLDKSEFLEGAAILEEKIRRFRPEVVCLVGKGIWDSICEAKNIERQRRGLRKWTAKNKHMGADFRHGWQVGEARTLGSTEGWDGAKTFVATSTSGLERTPKERKLEIWAPLGEFVQRRRRERGEWLVD
ncbi:MAG: hypothetical protein M4579_002314 [Chaenotheca gracillima]|nr:MAG: hypothetical protein M4579_002314 [Chaenotheca gracillima]